MMVVKTKVLTVRKDKRKLNKVDIKEAKSLRMLGNKTEG